MSDSTPANVATSREMDRSIPLKTRASRSTAVTPELVNVEFDSAREVANQTAEKAGLESFVHTWTCIARKGGAGLDFVGLAYVPEGHPYDAEAGLVMRVHRGELVWASKVIRRNSKLIKRYIREGGVI